MGRRALLRASARAGVAAAGLALVGCGGEDDDDPPDDQAEAEEQAAAQAQADAPASDEQAAAQAQSAPDDAVSAEGGDGAAAPAGMDPKPGGIARLFATTDNFDRFDPQRSRFRAGQQVFSLIYSRLLRPDSVSAGTLEPDLAGLPEQPDETTYVFALNPAAAFWDVPRTGGRAVTSEDVRLSFQRQIDGLNASGDPDLRFYRRALMARASAITASDPATVSFTTDAPDASFVASVIGGPWSFVISAEAIDELAPLWDEPANERDITLSSGSGPFVPNQLDGLELSLVRSENSWGATPAYLDGIVLTRSTNDRLGSDYVTAAIDALDFPLNSEQVDILESAAPESVRYEYPIDTPVQLSFGRGDDPENPFSDPRLGAAIAQSIDRFALIERLYAGDARPSGPAPWFLGNWALPEERLLEFPGYRPNKDDDLAEIALLVEAAGGADAIGELRLIVPDLFEGFYPGIGQSVAGMVERNAGLTLSTVFRSYAEITEQLEAGVLPSFLGWGPAPLQADPTDLWRDSVASGGAENYGGYANAEADALIEQMAATFDTGARQRLAHDVQELLLTTGYWRQNLTNGIQLGLRQPHFQPDPRLHDFAWSMHHLASSWIDVEADSYPERELPAITLDVDPAAGGGGGGGGESE